MRVSIDTPIHCVDELRKRDLVNIEEANFLKRVIRFRNIIVNEYVSVDPERIKNVIESRGYFKAFQIIRELHERLRKSLSTDP